MPLPTPHPCHLLLGCATDRRLVGKAITGGHWRSSKESPGGPSAGVRSSDGGMPELALAQNRRHSLCSPIDREKGLTAGVALSTDPFSPITPHIRNIRNIRNG